MANVKLEVFVNHVGYERRGPKRFLVASDEELDPFETSFEVRDGTSRTLWEGDLRGAGGPASQSRPSDPETSSLGPTRGSRGPGVEGRTGSSAPRGRGKHAPRGSEGRFFYVGEFDRLAYPGADLQVVVSSAGETTASYRFAVGDNLLWRLTKPVVLAYLRRARNTRANYRGPGEWKPNATLDDGRYVDVNGGWFEQGTHGGCLLETSSLLTWALLLAHDREPSDPQVEAEIIWAAEWWKKLAGLFDELGNLPDSLGLPDDSGGLRSGARSRLASRKLLAVMFYARFHRLTGDAEHLKCGLGIWENAREKGELHAGCLLPGAVEMYASTREERFREEAVRLAGILIETGPAALAELDPLLPGCLAHFAIRMKDEEAASRAVAALAGYMRGPLSEWAGSLIEGEGRSPAERGLCAWSALLACRASPRMDLLAYAMDQLNWLLGMNPRNSCVMSGVGSGGADAGKLGGPGAVFLPEGGSSPLGGTAAYLMALALL